MPLVTLRKLTGSHKNRFMLSQNFVYVLIINNNINALNVLLLTKKIYDIKTYECKSLLLQAKFSDSISKNLVFIFEKLTHILYENGKR